MDKFAFNLSKRIDTIGIFRNTERKIDRRKFYENNKKDGIMREKSTAYNERFGVMAAEARRNGSANLKVCTPQEVQWKPPLRQAAIPLRWLQAWDSVQGYSSGLLTLRNLTTCKNKIYERIVKIRFLYKMRKLHYIAFFVFLALCSCKKQNETVTLPFDKLYILEYRYGWKYDETYEEPCGFIFRVAGFCELDKNFNLQNVRQIGYDIYKQNSESVPDSMRNTISDILSRYQADTTFLYQGGLRIYDGNSYRFIMQKHNQKDITIKFEPQFLPDDLKFVYSYLCESQWTIVYEDKFSSLLEMFENQTKSEEEKLELKYFPLR